jgi:hypothetical protein
MNVYLLAFLLFLAFMLILIEVNLYIGVSLLRELRDHFIQDNESSD